MNIYFFCQRHKDKTSVGKLLQITIIILTEKYMVWRNNVHAYMYV